MRPDEMSELKQTSTEVRSARSILEKFDRAKILEVYFMRLDGRTPEILPVEMEDLFKLEMTQIKNFLLGQHPQDPILMKVFGMMN